MLIVVVLGLLLVYVTNFCIFHYRLVYYKVVEKKGFCSGGMMSNVVLALRRARQQNF